MLMVLTSAKLARYFFFPRVLPHSWKMVPPDKRTQVTADLLKISTRFVCLGFASPLWTRFSFDNGLEIRTLESCTSALEDVVLRYCFNGMRSLLSAVMMWEMCASELSWDIYLHHILLIVTGVILPDRYVTLDVMKASLVSKDVSRGFSFIVFFGATLMIAKEGFVLAYRCMAPSRLRSKARLLGYAELAHLAQLVPFFIVLLRPLTHVPVCLACLAHLARLLRLARLELEIAIRTSPPSPTIAVTCPHAGTAPRVPDHGCCPAYR